MVAARTQDILFFGEFGEEKGAFSGPDLETGGEVGFAHPLLDDQI